jgi:hypothetical protein
MSMTATRAELERTVVATNARIAAFAEEHKNEIEKLQATHTIAGGTAINISALREGLGESNPLVEEIAGLKRAQAAAMKALADATPNHPVLAGPGMYGPAGRDVVGSPGGIRVAFGEADLRNAHDALRRKQPFQIGAAIDDSSFTPSGVSDYRLAEIFPYLREAPIFADMFPIVGTEHGSVTVFQVTTPADAAAPVARGDLKPESDLAVTPIETEIETIAHVAVADNATIADYSRFTDVAGTEMVGGWAKELDAQILNGSGVSPEFHGILSSGSIGTVERDTSTELRSEAIHRGLTYVRTHVFSAATLIVLNPADLEAVRFEKSSGSGEFVNGPPTAAEPRSLWGIDLIVTTAITEGTALCLNPLLAGELYHRAGPTLEFNPWAEDQYRRNQTLMRAEGRFAFGLIRPKAVCAVLLY